jgi:hypothetical protein
MASCFAFSVPHGRFSKPQLLRVQSKGFELPFHSAGASRNRSTPMLRERQPTFDRRPNKTWREERERDRQVDLTDCRDAIC